MAIKATGIVRKVDELGRVVLPKELRRVLNIPEMQPMEIWQEDGNIIIKKYVPECMICGSSEDDVLEYQGNRICTQCINSLYKEKLLHQANKERKNPA